MVLEWKGMSYTVDELSAETGLAQRDSGLYPSELMALLALYKVDTRMTTDIRAEIDQGNPSICLIYYRYISARQNQDDLSLHFVLALGYTDTAVIVHDPDFYPPRASDGIRMAIPLSEWNKAFDSAFAVL
jgi:hypothetical protein